MTAYTPPGTPHDEYVLGGMRAIDDAAHEAEPLPLPRWTWGHVAICAAIAFGLGVLAWHVSGGVA